MDGKVAAEVPDIYLWSSNGLKIKKIYGSDHGRIT